MIRILLSLVVLTLFRSMLDAQMLEVRTHLGALANNHMGWSVSGAGDVNGDGYADVIAGEPLDFNAGFQVGAARVISGIDGSLLHVFHGDNQLDGFGTAVSGAGDVNGDGYADLIVGAYGDDDNGMTSGSARVFSGLDGSVLFTFHGDDADDHFGFSVSGAGDVNGDGHDDLIVGAFIDEFNGFDTGTARVFSGADGSVIYDLHGSGVGDRYGISVSGLGDVDGDGLSDFAVGAYRDDDNGLNSGSVLVYSGVNAALLYCLHGDGANDELGFPVSGAGDVNGDGYADIIAGARLDDDNGVDAGSARVYSGLDGSILHTFHGDNVGDHFGDKVSGAGDVNGDGHADLLVGALFADAGGADAGLARVLSGADGTILYTLTGNGAGDWFGYAVGGAGDLNGDGFADIVVGAIRDDDNGVDSGSVRVLLAPSLPVLEFRSASGLVHGLDLSWLPDGGDPLAVTGTIHCAGATPGATGLYGASLAPSDFPVFGYLPLLIAIDSINLLETGNFGYDALGELLLPGVTRSIPPLIGQKVFLQFFETSPLIASSSALRITIDS